MSNEPFLRRVGTRLKDKWTLERLLGVGGMAAVYLGVHTIGRQVAIKILHREVAAEPELRARFEEEARAVNRFRHPGAVEIVDTDVTEDGEPFLVMELLEGHSLQGLLDQGQVPSFDRLLQLIDELLDVLVAAHAAGIIHRDIKPDNLFVQRTGALKVLDFGIARVRTAGGARGPTRTGTTIGTVVFMSPEQVVGRSDLDVRADLFSVGATMFRVLTGRHVHEASGQFQLMVKAASDPAPPLASVLPGVPADVALVVDRALAFDRDHRYPDARTMQDDVRALLRRQRPPYAASLASGRAAGAAAAGPTPTVQVPVMGAAAGAMPATGVGEVPVSVRPWQPPSAGSPAGPLSQSEVLGPTSYGGGPASYSPTHAFSAPVPPAALPTHAFSAPPASAAAPSFQGHPATVSAAPPLAGSTQLASPLRLDAGAPANLIPPVSATRPAKKDLPVAVLGLGALVALLMVSILVVTVSQRGRSAPAAPEVEGGTSPVATATSAPVTASPGAATAPGLPTGRSTAPTTQRTAPAATQRPAANATPTVISLPVWGGTGSPDSGDRARDREKEREKEREREKDRDKKGKGG